MRLPEAADDWFRTGARHKEVYPENLELQSGSGDGADTKLEEKEGKDGLTKAVAGLDERENAAFSLGTLLMPVEKLFRNVAPEELTPI